MVFWLIALAAFTFGMYNVFIKLSSDHIQAVLGAVVLQFVAAFLGLGLLLYLQKTSGEPLHVTSRGVWLAVCAGVAIGIVEIATFFIFGKGIAVSVGNPLIIGGSLVVTTGVGVLFLREAINPIQLTAIILIGLGIALLAVGAMRTTAG